MRIVVTRRLPRLVTGNSRVPRLVTGNTRLPRLFTGNSRPPRIFTHSGHLPFLFTGNSRPSRVFTRSGHLPRLVTSTLAAALLFLSGSTLLAQDLDYPDFRSKKDNFSKINDQSIRGDIASFALAGIDESIGKAQLQTVPVKDYGPDFVEYDNGNIHVIIKTSFFMPTKHKLQFSEKHLLKIDGKPYYGGVYGEQPHNTIASVTVLVGKDTVPIPATAYNDLYEPKFSFNENGATRSRNGVYLSNDKHTFYIYMLNIDNGGAEYTWVIRDKQYIRRVVDFGFLNK